MEKNVKENAASKENSPQESKFEKWMNNGYAPCTKLVICAIKDDDGMSAGGRWTLGILGLIGAPVIDPAIWLVSKLGLED